MHPGMRLGIRLDRRKEKVLGPKVKCHTKQYQGRAQHSTVPERQANAHPPKQTRPWFVRAGSIFGAREPPGENSPVHSDTPPTVVFVCLCFHLFNFSLLPYEFRSPAIQYESIVAL